LFDRCAAVVASRHLAAATAIVPAWWGIVEVDESTQAFRWIRSAERNHDVEVGLMVQLLWRDEVAAVLSELEIEVGASASRSAMWRTLLRRAEPSLVREHVKRRLISRDPASARIPTRRFKEACAPAG
jgi:hypothetical protein